MVLRNPGRLLAPVALVAVLVAVIVVTNSDLGNHHTVTSPPRAQQPAVFHRTTPTTSYYVIKAGDSLSTISARTGVSLTQLESLNPSIDPNALQTGQRIRLRP
jgi:LysM repeat protein